MEELMKINAKIRKQQIGRLFAAGVCACCFVIASPSPVPSYLDLLVSLS